MKFKLYERIGDSRIFDDPDPNDTMTEDEIDALWDAYGFDDSRRTMFKGDEGHLIKVYWLDEKVASIAIQVSDDLYKTDSSDAEAIHRMLEQEPR